MKTILVIIFLALAQELYAPAVRVCYMASEPAINIYDNLIKAVVMVESNNGTYLYNKEEGATGYFQIRQCRVDHYNKLTGSNYSLNDCYDYELSRKIFLYFAKGKDFETAARNWNGSGPMTEVYWKRVKANL